MSALAALSVLFIAVFAFACVAAYRLGVVWVEAFIESTRYKS